MYAAVSGLRSHQIMMDVVGNNIANVNTQGYKRNQVIFQDVLSQIVAGASAPSETIGGRNPAQVGLGVIMSGTAQQFGQGFLQVTNRDLDVAVQGDGFFIVEQSGEQLYTRAGAFFLDADEVKLGGNLPSQGPTGEQVYTALEFFDATGNTQEINLTLEKTAVDQWTVTGTYGDAQTPFTMTDNVLTFSNGELTAPTDLGINIAAGEIPGVGDVELVIGGDTERRITQFGDDTSLTIVTQNGAAAGVLQSMRVGTDGLISGTYSNGLTQSIAMLALANFSNPEGLERLTGSNWRGSVNSGLAQIGVTSTGGRGTVAPGTLEMSNVDLALEFTELIRSQRGFQANSRVVTSSDELLQEIVNLKR